MRHPLALCLALSLLAPLKAFARDLPVSVVTEDQAYGSADQAAVAALRLALAAGRDVERGGFIVERGGAFYYSGAVSNGNTGHIAFRAEVPSGDKLVAIYHTHPGADGELSSLFSPDDVAEARSLGLASYIGVAADGTVRRFDPRGTPTRDYFPPGDRFARGAVSEGVIVAAEIR